MKTLALDRFLEEAQGEYIEVRLLGESYRIRAAVPALVPLKMARAEKLPDGPQKNEEITRLVFEAADALFGEEQMDRICAKGLSARDLSVLISKCFEAINGDLEGEDGGEELTDDMSRVSVPGRGKK